MSEYTIAIFENRTRAIKAQIFIIIPPRTTKIKPIFCGTDKTFPENWNSKAPSVGTLLAYLDYGLNHISFRNKTFLLFKIESWNFQHLFEKEFSETSQNFNSMSQRIEKIEIKTVWYELKFLRFHEILFQIDVESFSFLF